MKRKTEIYNGSYGRKWKSVWVVLILVFSIILVPVAGEEDNTGNGTSIGLNPEQVIEESNSAGSSENAGLSPEKELEEISDTDSQETAGKDQKLTIETGSRSERRENEIKALEPKALEPETRANNDIKSSDTAVSPESPENELESQDRAGDSADDLESAEKGQESDTGLNNEILDEESEDADPELKVRAGDGTQGKQSRVDGQEPEIRENSSAGSSESSENAGFSPEKEFEEISSTDSQETAGQGQKSTVEANNSSERKENETKALEPKVLEPETGANNDIKSNDTIISPESPENKLEPQKEASDSADDLESAEKGQESDTGSNNETPRGESEDTNPELKAGAGNETQGEQSKGDRLEPKTEEDKSTESQETGGENPDPEIRQNSSTGTQEARGEDQDSKAEENKSTGSQENTGNNLEPRIEIEEGIESQVKEETAPEQRIGEENTSESVKEKTEPETVINNDIDAQESKEEDQETGTYNETDAQESIEEDQETGTYNETDRLESVVETPGLSEQNYEAGGDIDSSDNDGSNLKLREKAEDRTDIKESAGTKTEPEAGVHSIAESSKGAGVEKEQETQVCNGTKALESKKVKFEVKTIGCNLTGSLLSKGVKPEIEICYWTNGTVNETVIPEIEQDESSWNNLRFILSYRYSPRSFYTVNESVRISYEGPETLGHQNVDVYLVKAYDPGFPEEVISNGINRSKVNLGDILSNNTEFYTEIPAVLNGDGDLSPLTLGPLPAGSYQVLITLAGNETEKSESEKELLSADHFEVLEYEMKAQAPYTLKEGESIEINLNLKNAPVQTGYTYWAVLVRADACKKDENSPARAAVWARPFVNGVDIIRNLETSQIENESAAGKDELRSEIQAVIGEGNGIISIGEENQSTLSLTGLDLPPGDYLLFAGAHEKDKGLSGFTRKELRISSKSSYGSGLSSLSGTDTFGNSSSMKSKYSPFMGISSILETPKTFVFEDVKPYIQTKALVEVVRNPPKIPSFLLGFAGTLLMGLVVMRIKK